jgi:hypothetical protein
LGAGVNRTLRRIALAAVVVVVIFLWVPPLASEADAPPPPLFAKPATLILALAAMVAGAALPGARSRRIALVLVLVASTIAAWILARILWGGYMPM